MEEVMQTQVLPEGYVPLKLASVPLSCKALVL